MCCLMLCLACSTISDAGIRAVAAACPGLQSLAAKDVSKLTDQGLVALSEGCPRLQVVPPSGSGEGGSSLRVTQQQHCHAL